MSHSESVQVFQLQQLLRPRLSAPGLPFPALPCGDGAGILPSALALPSGPMLASAHRGCQQETERAGGDAGPVQGQFCQHLRSVALHPSSGLWFPSRFSHSNNQRVYTPRPPGSFSSEFWSHLKFSSFFPNFPLCSLSPRLIDPSGNDCLHVSSVRPPPRPRLPVQFVNHRSTDAPY